MNGSFCEYMPRRILHAPKMIAFIYDLLLSLGESLWPKIGYHMEIEQIFTIRNLYVTAHTFIQS